mgnify:CR=1 FL=1
MRRLTPDRVASRLAFDHRVMLGLHGPTLGAVRAYRTEAERRSGREATKQEGEAGQVQLYSVDYCFPVLVGPGPTIDKVTALFNTEGSDNYPFTGPTVTIVSRPLPWGPHIHPANGLVCQGSAWEESQGRMLLGHLVVHVARLLNLDEPDRGARGDGYNHEAIAYWRARLGGNPLHPELEYPKLPVEVTHPTGRPPTEAPRFTPAPATPARRAGFRPLGAPVVERRAGFVPLRRPE